MPRLTRRLKAGEFIKVGDFASIRAATRCRITLTFPADIRLTHYGVDGRPTGRHTKGGRRSV